MKPAARLVEVIPGSSGVFGISTLEVLPPDENKNASRRHRKSNPWDRKARPLRTPQSLSKKV